MSYEGWSAPGVAVFAGAQPGEEVRSNFAYSSIVTCDT
jgi:hypothetical protein